MDPTVVELNPYYAPMMDCAKQYCNARDLDVEKLMEQQGGLVMSGRGKDKTYEIVFSQRNPNAQPQTGMLDDANLPFPTLIVHAQKDTNGQLLIWAEETPYTQKYIG